MQKLILDEELRLLYAWAQSQFQDDKELQRVRQEPGGMATAEAIAFLEEVARKGREQ